MRVRFDDVRLRHASPTSHTAGLFAKSAAMTRCDRYGRDAGRRITSLALVRKLEKSAAAAAPVAKRRPTTRRPPAVKSARRRVPHGELDATDVELIRLLSEDGRLTNRELGRRVGMAEVTVAARIQALVDRQVLGVSAVVDWRAAGYSWDLWIEVSTESGTEYDVGRDLAALDGVQAVYVVFGPYDLVVHAVFQRRENLVEFLNERVSSIRVSSTSVRRSRWRP